MSEEKQQPKKQPSEAEIRKALGPSAEIASIEGARVTIIYPDAATYGKRVSRDVEVLRALAPNDVQSEVSAHDPARESVLNPNSPIQTANAKPDGAQRLVVVIL